MPQAWLKELRVGGRLVVPVKNSIWRARKSHGVSYPPGGSKACFRVEADSFWFAHRNDCIAAAVQMFPPEGFVFDIGGGNGFVSSRLEKEGFSSVVVEPEKDGIRNARRRGAMRLVNASLEDAGFRKGCIRAAGLFDVIEHVEDDAAFMRAMHRAMARRGRLYLSVPAGRWLWSSEDESAGHYRRYGLRDIERLVKTAGFKV